MFPSHDQFTKEVDEKNKKLKKEGQPRITAIEEKAFYTQYFPDVLGKNGKLIGSKKSYEDLQKELKEKIAKKDEELKTKGYEVEFQGKKYQYSADFMRNFIDDYINPRFNYSKSMAEFKSYLDTEAQGETLLTTQTVSKAIKDYGEKIAKMYIDYLQSEGGGKEEFTLEEMKKIINEDMVKQMKNDKEGYSGNVFMNLLDQINTLT